MSIEKILRFVQFSYYEEMHCAGAKVQLLRQVIGEFQASLGLQRLEWTEHNVVGKFIATKKYDFKNQELYDLLDNHGVLSSVVKLKWNRLSESEKSSLQEFYLASNVYLRFSPVRADNAQRGEELVAYRENVAEKDIHWLLVQWIHHKRIYSNLVEQWSRLRFLALKEMLETNQHNVTLPVGKLSLVSSDPGVDSNVAYKIGGKELLQRSGKIDVEQLKLCAANGYFSISQVYELLNVQDIQTKYLLLTLTSERNMMEGLVHQNNRYSWINIQSKKGWKA
ncbi:MAG: hypothetical protein ACQEXX_00035 [Bacillota bacterium]